MQPHQQRVIDEKRELDIKITKLSEFMYTDVFAALNDGERGLLQAQLIIMRNYTDILQTRIEGF